MEEKVNVLHTPYAQTIIDLAEAMGTMAEFRNLESFTHVRHVKTFTGILLKNLSKLYPEYRLNQDQIMKICFASAVHDIGMVQVPDTILLKPGRLEPDEHEMIHLHTIYGEEILHVVPWNASMDTKRYCMEIARSHHERYDGKGYPDGLFGEDIPVSAQAVSVTEAFDALISDRLYRAAYTVDRAYSMILDGSCGVFSPKMLAAFRVSRPEIENFLENEAAAGESEPADIDN
jgi:putative two-component system response regulator